MKTLLAMIAEGSRLTAIRFAAYEKQALGLVVLNVDANKTSSKRVLYLFSGIKKYAVGLVIKISSDKATLEVYNTPLFNN